MHAGQARGLARRCGVTWSQTYPLKLPSGANLREHWATRARRASKHRHLAFLLVAANRPLPALPVTITLTRVAPRALDSDNLAYAFKATRDGIADAYGLDDRDPRITWCYSQEHGAAAIRIDIEVRS